MTPKLNFEQQKIEQRIFVAYTENGLQINPPDKERFLRQMRNHKPLEGDYISSNNMLDFTATPKSVGIFLEYNW